MLELEFEELVYGDVTMQLESVTQIDVNGSAIVTNIISTTSKQTMLEITQHQH